MLKKSTQYWLRVVLIVLAVIFLWAIIPVLWPLIVSLICTLILLPVVNGIQDYMRHRVGLTWFPRWLAIIPAFLLVALILLLVIQFIILPFIAESTRLLNNLPVLMSQLIVLWQDITSGEWLKLPPQIDAIVMTTLARISSYGVELAQRGIFAIFSLATTVLECLLVPIMTFYLLKDGRQIKGKVISIFQPPHNRYLMDVVNQIHRTMGRYLRGQLLLATNMFCITLVIAYFFELPYPLVLALFAAIAEWVPIIGPIVAAIPAIILASLVGPALVVKIIITYAIIQLIDGQIVMPKILGHVIKLHPLVILTVIFVGGYFYGIIGMMTAVPITAMLQIVLTKLWYFNSFYKKDGTV